ncbi:MAG: aldehyde dehydrogenase family protein [Candidatus Diapherotrites archaeon]|nr:aldehyde dehydrogenase family protein [Candidatus Diapherotrites archaeon]
MKTFKNYIDGKWVSSSSHRTFESINPATESVLGKFQLSNAKDTKAAIKAAWRAYKRWRLVPAPKRGELLLEVSRLLKKNKKRLGRLVTQEMGKVLAEGLGDVQEAIDMFELMAGEGRRLYGVTTPSELPEKFCMTVREPIGVLGLISPWNFPFAIPAWKIAPALIAGNTVVFKPASYTPLCATRLFELFDEAGIPAGVANLVTGSGREVGETIVTSNVRGISFTGSREVGLSIKQKAGLKRISLELGGKNPIIVMDDADLDLALDGCIWGAFGTTGQRCTATSRIIVHEKIYEEFLDMLVKRTRKLRLGDGLKPRTDVGPIVSKKQLESIKKDVELAKKEAKLVIGGKPTKINGKGFFFKPTIFTGVTPKMYIAQKEVFGPVVAIMRVKSLKQAVDWANSTGYGLSSAIYTNSVNNAFTAVRAIEAGLTYVNSSTIGSEVHLPFGGVKDTGSTREGGIGAIEEFTETKTVYFDYSGKLQKAQIDID